VQARNLLKAWSCRPEIIKGTSSAKFSSTTFEIWHPAPGMEFARSHEVFETPKYIN